MRIPLSTCWCGIAALLLSSPLYASSALGSRCLTIERDAVRLEDTGTGVEDAMEDGGPVWLEGGTNDVLVGCGTL